MSELSTVAIKDGHRGHLPHNSRQAAQPDAERADRISRLAGLERVTTARNPGSTSSFLGPASTSLTPGPGYFDPSGQPQMQRERSTVGPSEMPPQLATVKLRVRLGQPSPYVIFNMSSLAAPLSGGLARRG